MSRIEADARAAVARAQLLWAQGRLDGGGRRRPDPAEALAWFRSVALQGDAHALNMVGRALERGWGVEPDAAAAARCYERAAALGDGWAAFNLGDLALSGRGVAKDEARAYALYRLSAERGVAKALNMLGLLHEEARGCARDEALAEALFRAAAQGGDCWGGFNLGRRLADRGETAMAERLIRASLDAGFPDFWRAVAGELAVHPHPSLRALAHDAQKLAGPECG